MRTIAGRAITNGAPQRHRRLRYGSAAVASVTTVLVLGPLLADPAVAATHHRADLLSLGLSATTVSTARPGETVSGIVRDRSTKHALRGKKVEILWETAGTTTWRKLATVRTNNQGHFSATYTLHAAGKFEVRFSGDATYAASASPGRTVTYQDPTPADGTSFWASDDCHYYVANRQWYGDYCARFQSDTAGDTTKILDLYTYQAAGDHLGPEILQFDTDNPDEIVFRDLRNPLFNTVEWAAFPADGAVNADDFQVYVNLNNTWAWYTVTQLTQLADESQTGQANIQVSTTTGQSTPAGSLGTIDSQANNLNNSTLQLGSIASRLGAIGSSAEGTGADDDGCLSVAEGCTGELLGSATLDEGDIFGE